MRENKFLGKNIIDITIEDLIEYFSVEQEETSTIEFKSGEVSLEKIYPEICAFLNTNGGILIIGAPKKTIIKNKEIYKGDLVPSKDIKSGFILLQKVSSNIVPAALNIYHKELEYKDGKIFILNVPQSQFPPHQNSSDGKYYIRLESATTKAPHGFIQALFNKRQYPNLLSKTTLATDYNNQKHLIIKIFNESLITALKLGFIINIYGVKSFKKFSQRKKKYDNNNFHVNIYENEVVEDENINHFEYQDKSETLNKGLNITQDFIIETLESNYLLSVVIWAKDTELKHFLCVINPKDDEVLYKCYDTIEDLSNLFQKYDIKLDKTINKS